MRKGRPQEYRSHDPAHRVRAKNRYETLEHDADKSARVFGNTMLYLTEIDHILESSLIGVLVVKPPFRAFGVVPEGHSLLFAVGAGPPHDGVS